MNGESSESESAPFYEMVGISNYKDAVSEVFQLQGREGGADVVEVGYLASFLPAAERAVAAPFFPQATAAQTQPPLTHGVSRGEFNSSRLANLETSFLISQKTSMLESKLARLEGTCLVHSTCGRPLCTEVLDITCFCGFQPAKHTVRALSADYGKSFISCPLKDEVAKCSFFKWMDSKVNPYSIY